MRLWTQYTVIGINYKAVLWYNKNQLFTSMIVVPLLSQEAYFAWQVGIAVAWKFKTQKAIGDFSLQLSVSHFQYYEV